MKLLNFGVMLLFFNISKVGAQTEIDSITYTIGDVHVGIRSMGNEIPLKLTGTNTQIISSSEIEKLPVQTTFKETQPTAIIGCIVQSLITESKNKSMYI